MEERSPITGGYFGQEISSLEITKMLAILTDEQALKVLGEQQKWLDRFAESQQNAENAVEGGGLYIPIPD